MSAALRRVACALPAWRVRCCEVAWLAGLTWLWTALVLLAASSLAADWLLRFSLPVRQIILALGVAALAAIAYRKLLAPLAVRLDDLDLAAILDRRCRGYGQRVAAVLELPRLLEAGIGASPSMIRAAVLEHAETLEATDVSAAFDRRGPWRMAALIAATGIAAAAFVYLHPETAGLWARCRLQGSTERWPQRNYLAVIGLKDGQALLVPRGESLLVNVESQSSVCRPGGRLVARRSRRATDDSHAAGAAGGSSGEGQHQVPAGQRRRAAGEFYFVPGRPLPLRIAADRRADVVHRDRRRRLVRTGSHRAHRPAGHRSACHRRPSAGEQAERDVRRTRAPTRRYCS